MSFCYPLLLLLIGFSCSYHAVYSTPTEAVSSNETGTLLVSYHTNGYEDRLSRIRFLLIGSNSKEQMYPKGNAFVQDNTKHSRLVAIEQLPIGAYSIKFLVPNTDGLFEEVPERTVVISKDEVVRIDQNIQLKPCIADNADCQIADLDIFLDDPLLAGMLSDLPNGKSKSSTPSDMLSIPAGKAIIGNATSEEEMNTRPAKTVMISAFTINTYEVTNRHYAAWLNQALQTSTISYVKEADNIGQVLDMEGHLLFKTLAADPYSQIEAVVQEDRLFFQPIAGKENFPVIDVTWYGAIAYCSDYHCRLPTEAEWEKAAGMEKPEEGKPLKKFIYGFSQDTIDPSWANYRSTDKSLETFQVLTTPVGFYDGTNPVPHSSPPRQTHRAVSPYGAFDMSGNVWEWVSDWFDSSYYVNMQAADPTGPPTGTEKVVKGGCYDSLADGVRVSERLGLPPDHADAYTGFRIAK